MKNILNLTPAIKTIEKEINKLKEEFEEKIYPYVESLEQLRQINEACENCGGSGHILRTRSCAEDDRPDPDDPEDWLTCPDCHGTGRAKHIQIIIDPK